mmetsp:Transcript_44/g.52  ORF Transcript_44/g.52 Transcript_44/m.52 type:complete len:122 (-) Transcript_44:163-528(-)
MCVGGKWHKPKKSGRHRARIRKEAILNGEEIWKYDTIKNRNPGHGPVKFKGKKRERTQEARDAKILENMKNMPKLEEQYYTDMRARRIHKTDMFFMLFKSKWDNENKKVIPVAQDSKRGGK